MVRSGMCVGLDIGTTSVKVVVAEYVEGQMNIIGVGNVKSEGISRGIIVDIDKAVKSIKKAVKQAEEKAGIEIKEVNVGIPANMLEVEECQGMIAVNSDSKEITDEDVKNVTSAALVRSTPPERQIVAVIPQEFSVDGFEGIKDPRGMIGVRLEMYGLIYTGPKTIIHNTLRCIQEAGLQLDELVITPLALTSNILTDGEKDFGTTVMDMGGGQTTVAVMHDKQLKFAHVNQEGGEFISKDISIVLNTSFSNAEGLKINYGDAFPANVDEKEEFPVDIIGQNEPTNIDAKYLSEIIEARLEQIFLKAKVELDAIEALSLPGGLIVTGGAASLPGVVELAREVFDVNVRLYVPNHMGLRNPVFSNVISIVEYANSLSEIYQIAKEAVTGEKSPSKRAPQPVQNNNLEVSETNSTDTYKDDDDTRQHIEETEHHEPKDENGLINKVRSMFSNIFD